MWLNLVFGRQTMKYIKFGKDHRTNRGRLQQTDRTWNYATGGKECFAKFFEEFQRLISVVFDDMVVS